MTGCLTSDPITSLTTPLLRPIIPRAVPTLACVVFLTRLCVSRKRTLFHVVGSMAMVTRIKEEGIKSLTRGCGTLASSQHVHPKIREMILEMMRADTHHTPSSSYTHTCGLIYVYNTAREQGHTYTAYTDKKARKKKHCGTGKTFESSCTSSASNHGVCVTGRSIRMFARS